MDKVNKALDVALNTPPPGQRVWATVRVYDIGSCHPEYDVNLFTSEAEAQKHAKEESRHTLPSGDECPWENDPDRDDAQEGSDACEDHPDSPVLLVEGICTCQECGRFWAQETTDYSNGYVSVNGPHILPPDVPSVPSAGLMELLEKMRRHFAEYVCGEVGSYEDQDDINERFERCLDGMIEGLRQGHSIEMLKECVTRALDEDEEEDDLIDLVEAWSLRERRLDPTLANDTSVGHLTFGMDWCPDEDVRKEESDNADSPFPFQACAFICDWTSGHEALVCVTRQGVLCRPWTWQPITPEELDKLRARDMMDSALR